MAFPQQNMFVSMSDLELEQAQGGGETGELESFHDYIDSYPQLAQDVDGDLTVSEEEEPCRPPPARLLAVPPLTFAPDPAPPSLQPAYQDPLTPSRDLGYQYVNAYTPPDTQGSTSSGHLDTPAPVFRPDARQWQQTLPMTPSSMSSARVQQDMFGNSLVTPPRTSSINSQNYNSPIPDPVSGYHPGSQRTAPLPWPPNVGHRPNAMPTPTGYDLPQQQEAPPLDFHGRQNLGIPSNADIGGWMRSHSVFANVGPPNNEAQTPTRSRGNARRGASRAASSAARSRGTARSSGRPASRRSSRAPSSGARSHGAASGSGGHLPCPACSAKGKEMLFPTEAELRKHARIHQDGTFVCEFCGKSEVFEGHLVRHRKTHTGDRPSKCLFSGPCPWKERGFARDDHRDRHMSARHPEFVGREEMVPFAGPLR